MKILHIDSNHKLMLEQLNEAGFQNDIDYTSSKEDRKLRWYRYS